MLSPSEFREQLYIALARGYDLENSYTSYHVNGLDYLCLQRDREGLTIKIYDYHPSRNLDRVKGTACGLPFSKGTFLVHPHDHPYDSASMLLTGAVDNMVFSPILRGRDSRTVQWYSHPVNHDNPERQRRIILAANGGNPYDLDLRVDRYTGSGYWTSDPGRVHTLSSRYSFTLAQIQGPRQRRESRMFLHRDSVKPMYLQNTYTPMTRNRADMIWAHAVRMLNPPTIYKTPQTHAEQQREQARQMASQL